MLNTKLVVVSPIYWDVKNFQQVHQTLLGQLRAQGRFSDVLFWVVDDSAGLDPAIETLSSLSNVRVLSLPYNVGHQRALVYALRKLSFEIGDDAIVVTMDSDGEDKPEDLLRLVDQLESGPRNLRKIVLARRTKRKESLVFKSLYFVFKIVFRVLTGTIIRSGNYAAFYGWTAKRFLSDPRFNLCYSSTLATLRTDVESVPCERGARYHGKSHMGYLNLVKHGLRMLMPFIDVITIRALVFFFSVFVVGILLSAVVVGIKFLTGAAIPGWATYSILGIFILSLLALGNSIVLFLLFSQSQFLSMASLESYDVPRTPPSKTN